MAWSVCLACIETRSSETQVVDWHSFWQPQEKASRLPISGCPILQHQRAITGSQVPFGSPKDRNRDFFRDTQLPRAKLFARIVLKNWQIISFEQIRFASGNWEVQRNLQKQRAPEPAENSSADQQLQVANHRRHSKCGKCTHVQTSRAGIS